MSGDLIQFAEYGFLDDDGTYRWIGSAAHLVPPANRRRLLDRGDLEPRGDGWAYETRTLDDECTAVTRIRWDDARLYAEADLERHLKGWRA